jgi:hypothetical protein
MLNPRSKLLQAIDRSACVVLTGDVIGVGRVVFPVEQVLDCYFGSITMNVVWSRPMSRIQAIRSAIRDFG